MSANSGAGYKPPSQKEVFKPFEDSLPKLTQPVPGQQGQLRHTGYFRALHGPLNSGKTATALMYQGFQRFRSEKRFWEKGVFSPLKSMGYKDSNLASLNRDFSLGEELVQSLSIQRSEIKRR